MKDDKLVLIIFFFKLFKWSVIFSTFLKAWFFISGSFFSLFLFLNQLQMHDRIYNNYHLYFSNLRKIGRKKIVIYRSIGLINYYIKLP